MICINCKRDELPSKIQTTTKKGTSLCKLCFHYGYYLEVFESYDDLFHRCYMNPPYHEHKHGSCIHCGIRHWDLIKLKMDLMKAQS